MDRTKNRSDRYQALFAELPYSNEMLSDFAEKEGIGTNFNPELRERYLDAKERLRGVFWRLVDTQLTPRQSEVIKLYCQKLTQIEIAKRLNVNQSSITKSINGNCDYRNGRRIYGGSLRKLRRLAAKDPEAIAILQEIIEINEEAEYSSY